MRPTFALTMRPNGGSPRGATSPFQRNSSTAFSMAKTRFGFWREYRGLTIKAFAETSGLATAYLSQTETGKREGTIGTFKKIAAALRIDIDDFA